MFRTACAASCLLFAAVAVAQEPAKPGPEHEVLKKMQGQWSCKLKVAGQESEGRSTYRMDLGGLWLSSTFNGEVAGQPFSGRGFDSYDAKKKKYVSIWIDSMSTNPMMMEGTYDAEKKTLTMTGEGVGMGPEGATIKMKTTTQLVDEKTMKFTMFMIPDAGEPIEMMSIEYNKTGDLPARKGKGKRAKKDGAEKAPL